MLVICSFDSLDLVLEKINSNTLLLCIEACSKTRTLKNSHTICFQWMAEALQKISEHSHVCYRKLGFSRFFMGLGSIRKYLADFRGVLEEPECFRGVSGVLATYVGSLLSGVLISLILSDRYSS